jgi:hypothetical protein
MAKGEVETTIARSAEEVWARVGDYGDVSWIPNATSATVDGDIRTVQIGGRETKQRLLNYDEEGRTYSYVLANEIILDNGEKAKGVAATITVVPDGPSQSRLIWGWDAEGDEVSATHATFYGGIIAQVKADLEGS